MAVEVEIFEDVLFEYLKLLHYNKPFTLMRYEIQIHTNFDADFQVLYNDFLKLFFLLMTVIDSNFIYFFPNDFKVYLYCSLSIPTSSTLD